VDISERTLGETFAERLAAIVESSDDAIISKDLNGIIASWNKGAERIFGYVAEEVIGKPILILIPQDRQNEEIFILERIRRGVDHYDTVRSDSERRKPYRYFSERLTYQGSARSSDWCLKNRT
jgi:PAS domain S-box-containing protein